ncbi:hypothetical protein WN51_11397, partial [Melipona quadrifasciata]
YQEWLSFKDRFMSMIDNKATLSDIEKLHYLRSALVHGPRCDNTFTYEDFKGTYCGRKFCIFKDFVARDRENKDANQYASNAPHTSFHASLICITRYDVNFSIDYAEVTAHYAITQNKLSVPDVP